MTDAAIGAADGEPGHGAAERAGAIGRHLEHDARCRPSARASQKATATVKEIMPRMKKGNGRGLSSGMQLSLSGAL